MVPFISQLVDVLLRIHSCPNLRPQPLKFKDASAVAGSYPPVPVRNDQLVLRFGYEQASDTTGYVLWTRSDTGRAVVWSINPTTGAGSPRVIPRVGGFMSIWSTAGIGGPWEATSYRAVSSTEGYLLWSRTDTGRAVLWKVDPSLPTGPGQRTGVWNIYSASGVGGPWQASSYCNLGPVVPGTLDVRLLDDQPGDAVVEVFGQE